MILMKQKDWLMISGLTWIKSKIEQKYIWLGSTKAKTKYLLLNKRIQVVYQLFNSCGFNKEFEQLFSKIKSEQTEEEMQIPLFSQKESERTEEEMQIHYGLKKINQSLTN